MLARKILAIATSLTLVTMSFVACSSEGGEKEALNYPEKSINIIVPYAAGGGTDILARTAAKYLDLGQSVVVTNMEGGSSAIGTMEAYNSPADGYTLFCCMPESMMGYYLGGSLKVPAHDDFEMISTLVYDANILSTSKNSKFKTFEDVVTYAKANPGKLNWASVGAKGSNEQASAEIWKAAGIEVNYIPFDSASKSRVAVMGGHADVLFGQISEVKPIAQAGDIVPLAISMEERSKFFPETPIFKELGYDIVNGLHRGFMASPETPKEIVEILEKALKEVYDNPEFISLVEEQLGFQAMFVGAKDLETFIAERYPIQESLYNLIK